MTPRKIWVISELYYPEETSTGYLLSKIAEGLAHYHKVGVICGQPTYAGRGSYAQLREVHNGVDIRRCISTTLNKDVLALRLANLITVSLSIFFKALLNLKSKDIVLVVTNPPLLPFLVCAACRLRRAKCLLLIHDVYPEVIVASGLSRPNSLPVRAANWLTRSLYGRMERIIVLGRDMDRLVKGKLDKEHSRVIIIPNWADLDSVVPASKDANLLLKELGLGQKFVVQYAGNMGRTHGLESLLDSAEALARDANVHFLFIGTGAKKPWIERLVRERKLTNVTVLGNRPRADQPNFLNACDVSIISFVPGMAGISVPSRMYNIMAAGKPIIAVADSCSEIALVVEEENIGWVVPPGQSDEISKVIKAAYSNPRLLMEMGQRAHLIAEKKYSIASVIDSYHELIKGICVCSD